MTIAAPHTPNFSGETTITWCPSCDGEGGWNVLTHYNHHGEECGYWEDCSHCDGTGESEEPIWLIEEDDLDDWIGLSP
jgi:hypothetical protein